MKFYLKNKQDLRIYMQAEVCKAVTKRFGYYENPIIRIMDSQLGTEKCDLVIAPYLIGYDKSKRIAYLWRIEQREKVCCNCTVYQFDTNGNVVGVRTMEQSNYYKPYPCFMGQHLIDKPTNKHKPIAIVQDELHAFYGAVRYPDYVWLAVGYGSNLTKAMLDNLGRCRNVALMPTDTELDYWRQFEGGSVKIRPYLIKDNPKYNMMSWLEKYTPTINAKSI